MNYEDMLKRAKEKSSGSVEGSRFKAPEVEIIQEGNKTIVKNFSKISDKLRRNKDHLMKFFTKELAVPGDKKNSRAVFYGRFTETQVEDKLQKYIEDFVLCPACGKSDTELIKEEGVTKIKCEACGTKQFIKKL